MNADGTGLLPLTDSPAANEDTPTVCDHGKLVIFASDRITPGFYDLYSVNIDGSNEKLLNSSYRSQRTPSCSKDGKYVYYDSAQDAPVGSINRDIYRMDIDGSNQVNMTNTPDVSEDGPQENKCDSNEIFTTRNTASGRFDIFAFDLTKKTFRNITNKPFEHDRFLGMSNDCKKIVYEATNGFDAPGSWEINLMNPDGTNQTRLTDTGNNRYPSFSPDDQKIIFTSDRFSSSPKVFTMLQDGSDQKAITTGTSGEERPTWAVE